MPRELQEQMHQDSPAEMEEDAEYQRQLALFSQSSTEKGIELLKIGELMADLTRRRSFLDIGAGGGHLTIPVSQSFDESTVVEPNERQAAFLKRRCPHFTVIEGFWDEANLDGKSFDFILCSHVLYYIPEGKWLTTIAKMHSHLTDGGRIAIVLQSPLGEVADFFNRFTRYDVNILELWRDLQMVYGEDAIDVRYFTNEIWTDNLDDMATIGLFLLIHPWFKEREPEIRDYFEEYCRVGPDYRIVQDEIMLVIKR